MGVNPRECNGFRDRKSRHWLHEGVKKMLILLVQDVARGCRDVRE
jgi:hypothetical protein